MEDLPRDFDMSLAPHVLTDKAETKTLPCRECGRQCVVNRFAAPAKVACNDHRDRHAKVESKVELKEDMEPHILTDKEATKTVACRGCGRPCIVTTFASATKVACNDCRKFVPRPKRQTVYKKNGNGDRMEAETTVEMQTAEEIRRAVEELCRPSLPIWPDGDDKDRARLLELGTAAYTTRIQVDEARAAYSKVTRELRRTERYQKARTQEEQDLLISEVESRKAETKKEQQERDEEAAALRAEDTKESLTPEPPKELVEAQARLAEITDSRRVLRREMVSKLIERGYEDPYAEERGPEVDEIERIPVRHQLERMEVENV